MTKIGLIAGGGTLPFEFLRSARQKGHKVVLFALKEMADPEIEKEAAKTYWLDINQYAKFVFILFKENIKQLAFLGKVKKHVVFQDGGDEEYKKGLGGLKDKKDSTIFQEIRSRLKIIGVEVIPGGQYLSHLLLQKGPLSKAVFGENGKRDVIMGYEAAKKMAEMDIGQTVIVKDGVIVAVEGIEGTDATIVRGRELGGPGCVMVKVARPRQDMGWDVPTVGPETMIKLMENGYSGIAVESGKMYLVEKERFVMMADAAGIVVEAL